MVVTGARDGDGSSAGSLVLRDYQRAAVARWRGRSADGLQRLLLALPMGTGKTVIAALVAAENKGRTLVLVHRDELVDQLLDKLRLVLGGASIGVVKAKADECHADVVIASIQTLAVPRRLQRLREVAQKMRHLCRPLPWRAAAARCRSACCRLPPHWYPPCPCP
jgi:superfamily II DNA or RNA helicase